MGSDSDARAQVALQVLLDDAVETGGLRLAAAVGLGVGAGRPCRGRGMEGGGSGHVSRSGQGMNEEWRDRNGLG